jgi:hypothetical protein
MRRASGVEGVRAVGASILDGTATAKAPRRWTASVPVGDRASARQPRVTSGGARSSAPLDAGLEIVRADPLDATHLGPGTTIAVVTAPLATAGDFAVV